MIGLDDIVPLHLADVTYPADHPLAGSIGPVLAFAIRHEHGVILVDTGVGQPHPRIDERYRPVRTHPRTALLTAELDPDRVFAIINTHLHFDHCGGNARFPQASIFVQRIEHEAAQEAGYTVPEFLTFAGAHYTLLDGDSEIVPGVHVIATPGHTPGHQSVLVETVDGPVLIAGQVCATAAEFSGRPERFADDATRASIARLHKLAPVLVHFSHDTETWAQ